MSYKIYPAIGVARVGNAPSKFYIGPESYRGLPSNPDDTDFTEQDLRDDQGRLCRQAARFRIYHIDDDTGVETEITLDSPNVKSIRWVAHIANKKASWYEFATNEGEQGYASNHPLRNAGVADRSTLIIDPGPRVILGRSVTGVNFDSASVPSGYTGANFPDGVLNPVGEAITTLGELQTDAAGRLLLLGGLGIAGSLDDDPAIHQYANNDGWWDDTADGPVSAEIEFEGEAELVTAEAAWVLVGPPSYAPEIPNLVTLWDTIFDAAVRNDKFPAIQSQGFWKRGADGYLPNFQTEIQPLLERATLYPWVTAIPPKPHTFDMTRLGTLPVAGESDENRGLRNWILDYLRPPSAENSIINAKGGTMMPYLAGDNCLIEGTLTSKYLRLTDTQYFFLQQWADGWFVNQADTTSAAEALTRNVLENCVGGAFSPGIEMTWISRNTSIYRADDPFRINHNLCLDGPLGLGFTPEAMEPGDVTRYMAIPWQADFNECSSQPMDGRVIWWWPAQRPEFVYLEPEPVSALKAIPAPPTIDSGRQVAWIGTDFDQTRDNFIAFPDDILMVKYWDQLGFVMQKLVDGEQRFVEVSRTLARPEPNA